MNGSVAMTVKTIGSNAMAEKKMTLRMTRVQSFEVVLALQNSIDHWMQCALLRIRLGGKPTNFSDAILAEMESLLLVQRARMRAFNTY